MPSELNLYYKVHQMLITSSAANLMHQMLITTDNVLGKSIYFLTILKICFPERNDNITNSSHHHFSIICNPQPPRQLPNAPNVNFNGLLQGHFWANLFTF